jgi:hypothetical protein
VTYLPPGETTRIDLDAAEGIIFGVSLEGRAAILYPVEGPPATKPQIFNIVHGEKVRKHTVRTIAPGAVTFEIQNLTGERGTFCLGHAVRGISS